MHRSLVCKLKIVCEHLHNVMFEPTKYCMADTQTYTLLVLTRNSFRIKTKVSFKL